jgi:hypothetical protein
MKRKTILKIILWTLAVLLLISGSLFSIGYFYYAKIIRSYLIETVSKESKGLYKADIGSLSLNILAGNLTIDKFALVPDTALYHSRYHTDTLSPLLIQFKIDQFRIRGFNIMDAVKKRRIDVNRIRFIGPDITVYRMRMPAKTNSDKHKEKMTSIPLPKGLTSIEVREFMVENAKLEFIDLTGDTVKRNSFPTCNIFIKNILVDSVHQGKKRLFNADDINIKLGQYSLTPGNGMNKLSYGEIGLSTGSGEVYINNFHLEPLFSKHDYTRKLGFQTDWLDLKISRLKLQRVNFRSLLFEGKVQAGLLTIDTLLMDDYRDKRIPLKPGFKPPMPQEGIRKLKTYLRIDTVMLKSGRINYAEQTGAVPGTIFFDKVKVTVTGLTNDSVLLHAGLVTELKGTLYLMGTGKIDATVRMNFADLRNSFTFSAQMGPFDLTQVNPMVTNLLPAKIISGKVKKVIIPLVQANDDVATGKLLFYYNDISIDLLDEKQTTWTKIKTGVIKWAANELVLNADNPNKAGKMRTGIIYAPRIKELGFPNYFWRCAFSGLKSTMGFNSKAQKALIKEEKAATKEKAKGEKSQKPKENDKKEKKEKEKKKKQ